MNVEYFLSGFHSKKFCKNHPHLNLIVFINTAESLKSNVLLPFLLKFQFDPDSVHRTSTDSVSRIIITGETQS